MLWTSEIANVLGIALPTDDLLITGVSTDSRSIKPGELFIALSGEQFDGHQYIQQAADRGAGALLVSQPVDTSVPILSVDNTRQALLALAKAWRQRFQIPVVGITGSCGKTSTRALLQSILSLCGPTLASERSYNNDIGVPLTLLRLRDEHQYAVVEMGANHPGEIAELVDVVDPSVAMITLAAASHLAGFGDLQGVAKAKSEIFSGLSSSGIAIINQDDTFAPFWHEVKDQRACITFGILQQAAVMAKAIKLDQQACPTFDLVIADQAVTVTLDLLGRHHVMNALAAAAAAHALNVPLSIIKQGLETAEAETRRLVGQKGHNDALVIDDSYNANPASVGAAIDVLSQYQGTRVLVLGDMVELGESAIELHQAVGQQASQAGIARLFCYGDFSKKTAEAFGDQAVHFSDKETLIKELIPLLNSEVTVLVKGSNSMGMNSVAKSLLKE